MDTMLLRCLTVDNQRVWREPGRHHSREFRQVRGREFRQIAGREFRKVTVTVQTSDNKSQRTGAASLLASCCSTKRIH